MEDLVVTGLAPRVAQQALDQLLRLQQVLQLQAFFRAATATLGRNTVTHTHAARTQGALQPSLTTAWHGRVTARDARCGKHSTLHSGLGHSSPLHRHLEAPALYHLRRAPRSLDCQILRSSLRTLGH